MLNTEWTIVAAMVSLPIACFAVFEGIGYTARRRERARAHRSKRQESIRR